MIGTMFGVLLAGFGSGASLFGEEREGDVHIGAEPREWRGRWG